MHPISDTTPDNPIERADLAVAEAAAETAHHPVVRALGTVSDLADQPPLTVISAAVLAAGLVTGKDRMARAGMRMLVAHGAATAIKTLIKRSVDRTRPHVMDEEGRYERGRADHDEGPWNSFPSGHTASAVAVARAWSREYPDDAALAGGAAAFVGVMQITRLAHYPTDVAAGVVVGLVAEALTARAGRGDQPMARSSTSFSRSADRCHE